MGFFVRVRGLGRFFGAGVGGAAVGVSCAARGRSGGAGSGIGGRLWSVSKVEGLWHARLISRGLSWW